MLSLWNLYLLVPLSLPLSLCVTGKDDKETQRRDADPAAQHIPQPTRGPGIAPVDPLFGPAEGDFLGLPLSWPSSSSSEESEGQGVIGEYADLQETSEDLVSRSAQSDTEDGTFKERTPPTRSSLEAEQPRPSQQQTFKYESAETSTETTPSTDSHSPFLLSGSLPSSTTDQDSTWPPSSGPGPGPDHPTEPTTPSSGGWSVGSFQVKKERGGLSVKETEDGLVGIPGQKGAVSVEAEKDDFRDNGLNISKTSGTLMLDGNADTFVTPCKTTNHSWTPTYPEDITPNNSMHPSLTLSPALYVPLYSDWNSALATWGFAWEAHIYGLGSVFIAFGLISVVCLLGLPLRCPAGSPYFTLLHLFLLAFAGIQAFCLLYDAYSHQDRLPPLGSLLLSELPFPCLISAFSLAFLLLSLRSRMRLSLPLAISTSCSALPKPCLLLCLSLVHFGVSLGCVGTLQLFHILPTTILLFPQCLFVCLTIFLSFSYLNFYCLIRVDTNHIYRLNDNGESGGSPEIMPPVSCPFAKVEDWHRAACAGVGASLCLLGCGGLQLYGVLHALGFGGVDGYGFHPWSWWGYQVGCRLCEIGVCLGLSLIGTHPLFCHKNSTKTITRPRPGSWSRLSCSSPSRELTLPSHGGANSPILPSHDSWPQGKMQNLVVCNIKTKGHSEALALGSMIDHPGTGLDCQPKSNQIHKKVFHLPTPPSPPQKHINVDSQQSSLDSLGLETDSTVDLRPPSPIDLSRSIDQALFSESLFSHSIFGLPRIFHASSSTSLTSPGQGASKQGPSSVENSLYRTSSCGDMDQEKTLPSSRCSQPRSSLTSHSRTPEQWDLKGSVSGSTQGLCSNPKEAGKLRSHSWANRGQNFTQHSLPRALPYLSYHRRYRTLSMASRDIQGSGRLAGTKHLSESKQLEWDLAVQAEFVNVCRQIDALSVCSDTIEL